MMLFSAVSSPAWRQLAPCFRPGGIVTDVCPSGVSFNVTSSCITTVSRSDGMTAPVKIRVVEFSCVVSIKGAPAITLSLTGKVVP